MRSQMQLGWPGADGAAGLRAEPVRRLARHVLGLLAARGEASPASRERDRVRQFCEALLRGSDEDRNDLVERFLAAGVSPEELCDVYAPQVARQLGEGWVDDTLSFAEVTLGAARLQEIVRGIEGRGEVRLQPIPLGRSMLLAVPACEDHCLGAFIAANHFRRLGLWVSLAIGMAEGEIADTVQRNAFSLVGISVGSRRSVAPVAKLVKEIRGRDGLPPPIVVGGSAVALEPDLRDLTGADLVTTAPREAVAFCGLMPLLGAAGRAGTSM